MLHPESFLSDFWGAFFDMVHRLIEGGVKVGKKLYIREMIMTLR